MIAAAVALAFTLPGVPDAAVGNRGLHAVGNRLVDGRGRPVRLHGVNRQGEYACIQGWGILDGPSDAASVRAMVRWKVNAVRLMLNHNCWLGINGVDRRFGGAAYRDGIVRYVRLLHRFGLYAELSLAWGAPGANRATYQPGAPDADNSPAFWQSLASVFRDDPNVILAPWGETSVNPRCFRDGGVCEATFGPDNVPYRTAGMQEAVTIMRRAGYRGVIAIPGVDYANDLGHWLSYMPRDPLHQLAAEAHLYGGQTCSSPACLTRTYLPVARRVPLFLGETGETVDGVSCSAATTHTFLRWADLHASGAMAWTWTTWKDKPCGTLVSDYRGTPTKGYGAGVRRYFLARAEVAPELPQ
jgi:hypothetical protein